MADYYALVPAAGTGSRMESRVPKQYLSIFDKPILHHTLSALCNFPAIRRTFVVLSEEDQFWQRFEHPYIPSRMEAFFCGGRTRAETVLKGLVAIAGKVKEDDWILVHDAARPCLNAELIGRLIETVGDDPVGGLLAAPVADTMKRSSADGRVQRTEAREGLWQAQTPQMFRYGLLRRALANHLDREPSDESMAVEMEGGAPKLVPSDSRNIKITYPRDLLVAQMILNVELEQDL